MTDRQIFSWSISFAVFMSFLWVVRTEWFGGKCEFTSFAYPAVFAAAAIPVAALLASETNGSRMLPEVEGPLSMILMLWGIAGSLAVFGAVVAGIGWFLGVTFLCQVGPEYGDYRCMACRG